MTAIMWIMVIFCSFQTVSTQPTDLDDVTLCSDVRDYATITRTLGLVVQELKSLRASVTSLQNSQENFHKDIEKTFGNIHENKDNPIGVNTEDLDIGLQRLTNQIIGQISMTHNQLASRLNLMTSSLDHHSDKIDLDYQKLRFYISQKFSALFSSKRLSDVQTKQAFISLNSTLYTKIDTIIRDALFNLNTSHGQLEKSIKDMIGYELSNTRASMETTFSLFNQTISSDLNTLTSSAMNGLVHIKDILNHHHVTTRLSGGTSILNGRVEVYLNGVWGTVCDDDWDDLDAAVICRKVGFCNGTALLRGFYGQGTGPVILDNVACEGHETDIFDCPHNGLGIENCDRFEDAAVQCVSCD